MSIQTIDIINILEANNRQRDLEATQKKFSLSQLSRLNKIIENNDGFISSALWDLLLFKVCDLFINDNEMSILKPNGYSLIRELYKELERCLRKEANYSDEIGQTDWDKRLNLKEIIKEKPITMVSQT
jgi:hypothetical protein